MHIEEHNHCFMHYLGVKTLSETLFSPPLMRPGHGARYGGADDGLYGGYDDGLYGDNDGGLYQAPQPTPF